MKKNNKIRIELSRDQALAMDLLWCSCGHRPNNHFDHGDQPCAHCECKKYTEEVWNKYSGPIKVLK